MSLRGTGDEVRDFMHVADLAAGIESIAHSGECRGEVWNVASGRGTRIADISSVLAGIAGFKGKIRFDGEQIPGYPTRWQADVARLDRLGFNMEHTLESGLAATWRWYQSLAHV